MADAFMPLMYQNADASLRYESGCRRFDVLSDPTRPEDVFLYELYDSHEAFKAHLETQHFRDFDGSTASMISAKDAKTYEVVKT